MNSIVLSLQKDIYESKLSMSDILRKSYVLAKKLNLPEFQLLLHSELNGYSNPKDIPQYRTIRGTIRAWNPYRGWQPVIISDPKLEVDLTTHRISQSIPELEDLLNRSENGGLHIPLSDSFSNLIDFQTKAKLDIGASQVANIIETVKNIILEWSLKLEDDGILGEDMEFTTDEKSKATQKNYTVNNFYGAVSQSQFQQNSQKSNQSFSISEEREKDLLSIISLIEENISDIGLTQDLLKELHAEIKTIKAQLESPKPKSNVIYESLKSTRNIIEGTTGGLIASGIIYEISKLIR